MSKKISRIPSYKLTQQKPSLIGITLDIVLKTGQVHKGIIVSWENDKICFEDGLLLKHWFTTDQIQEIIVDQVI